MITFRELTENDIPNIHILEELIYEDESQAAFTTQASFIDPRFRVALGAFEGKNLIGYLLVVNNYWNLEKPQWYINDIAVHPLHQRKGMAKALLHHLVEKVTPAPIIGDNKIQSYLLDTRSSFWKDHGYYVEVVKPELNSHGQQHVVKKFGSPPEYNTWHLCSWELDRMEEVRQIAYPYEPTYKKIIKKWQRAEKYEPFNLSTCLVNSENKLIGYILAFSDAENAGYEHNWFSEITIDPSYESELPLLLQAGLPKILNGFQNTAITCRERYKQQVTCILNTLNVPHTSRPMLEKHYQWIIKRNEE